MSRSKSGQHEKIRHARAVVDEALGGAARRDAPRQAGNYVPGAKVEEPVHVRSEAIRVLTLKEAATRLGITIGELEAMVRLGKVQSLRAGWTTLVPTIELRRLETPA